MKAAVMEAFRAPLVVRAMPDPECPPSGAIVRTAANGICRSDWHAWSEHWPGFLKLPWVLGHELCGTVEEVGPATRGFRRGDRVIVPFSGGDGTCPWCRQGLTNLCDHPVMPGFRSFGGFGEYVAIAEADLNLVALPESVDFVAGAGLGCRFMTAFHGLVARGQVKPGEWVVVYGCGGVGLSAIEIAQAIGANVVGVDITAEKLAKARELGAVATVDSRETDRPDKAVRELTGGGAHVSVDALGIQVTARAAVNSLRKRGRHVQIGMTNGENGGELSLPVDTIINAEIDVRGSKGMPPQAFPEMLAMVAAGRLDPARLVTRRVAIEEASDVLMSMGSFDTLGFAVIDRF